MLNLGSGELIFIFLAALVLLGSKRMPDLARTLGKVIRDLRKVADDFRKNIGG